VRKYLEKKLKLSIDCKINRSQIAFYFNLEQLIYCKQDFKYYLLKWANFINKCVWFRHENYNLKKRFFTTGILGCFTNQCWGVLRELFALLKNGVGLLLRQHRRRGLLVHASILHGGVLCSRKVCVQKSSILQIANFFVTFTIKINHSRWHALLLSYLELCV